ncbi:MAG TPA: response regulator [Gemmatimonadales bacterium]|jgi:DNA-binding NtrC family response regulator|nr:response regulator [Gemmatimonadales bacterium]
MTVGSTSAPRPSRREREIREQVLVVDDEHAIRRFAARVLLEAGYVVHEAADGAEALAFITAVGAAVDVVVSDIVMPRLNGVELVEALASTHPALPVILMTGFGAGALAERGIAAPCAVLAKPFAAERLLDEVRRCVKERL